MSDWFSGRRGVPTFESLQNELNRVFTDFGFTPPTGQAQGAGASAMITQPKVDVLTTEGGGYEIHAELPGVEEKDIDLSVDGNVLTLSGERRQAREEGRRSYRIRERTYGAFSRTIALPFEPRPEQIDAEFRNGLLTVRVQKPKEPEQRGSKVQIRTTGSGGGSGQTGASGQVGQGQTGSQTSSQTGGSTGGLTEASGMMNEGGTADTGRSGGMLNEGM